MIAPVVARFTAPCPECERRIEPGELIRHSDEHDQWVHADCRPRVSINVARCPFCADVLTTSGDCESCS